MIELIYNEEETSITGQTAPAEPKNRKQIGEPGEYKKIFIEDYVHTYLLQYSNAKDSAVSVAILLGRSERSGGKRHLYIKSALTVDGVTQRQGKYIFTEKIWGTVYQESERYFPGQEIVGWFLAKPGFPVEKDAVMEETHRTYFSGAEKVLFLLEPIEGESGFYGFDGNRFARQPGYYIYYEKNEAMREFMLAKNGQHQRSAGAEVPDRAVASFRKIIREKQERTAKRKKLAVSYGARAAAALVLLMGVTAFLNRTQPERENSPQDDPQPAVTASAEGVIVEEVPGRVQEQPQTELVTEAALPVTEDEEPPEENDEELSEDDVQETSVTYVEYIVQQGDTLAKICREHYGNDARIGEVCALNGISDGDYIQAGEIILLP